LTFLCIKVAFDLEIDVARFLLLSLYADLAHNLFTCTRIRVRIRVDTKTTQSKVYSTILLTSYIARAQLGCVWRTDEARATFGEVERGVGHGVAAGDRRQWRAAGTDTVH